MIKNIGKFKQVHSSFDSLLENILLSIVCLLLSTQTQLYFQESTPKLLLNNITGFFSYFDHIVDRGKDGQDSTDPHG